GIVESSRRQEAMLDPHGTIGRIASELQSVRAKGSDVLRHSIESPDELSDVIKKRDKLDAARDLSHPLYALAVRPDDSADFNNWKLQTLAKLKTAGQRAEESRRQSELFKSFSQTGYKDWVTTGWAFGAGPTRACEWD